MRVHAAAETVPQYSAFDTLWTELHTKRENYVRELDARYKLSVFTRSGYVPDTMNKIVVYVNSGRSVVGQYFVQHGQGTQLDIHFVNYRQERADAAIKKILSFNGSASTETLLQQILKAAGSDWLKRKPAPVEAAAEPESSESSTVRLFHALVRSCIPNDRKLDFRGWVVTLAERPGAGGGHRQLYVVARHRNDTGQEHICSATFNTFEKNGGTVVSRGFVAADALRHDCRNVSELIHELMQRVLPKNTVEAATEYMPPAFPALMRSLYKEDVEHVLNSSHTMKTTSPTQSGFYVYVRERDGRVRGRYIVLNKPEGHVNVVCKTPLNEHEPVVSFRDNGSATAILGTVFQVVKTDWMKRQQNRATAAAEPDQYRGAVLTYERLYKKLPWSLSPVDYDRDVVVDGVQVRVQLCGNHKHRGASRPGVMDSVIHVTIRNTAKQFKLPVRDAGAKTWGLEPGPDGVVRLIDEIGKTVLQITEASDTAELLRRAVSRMRRHTQRYYGMFNAKAAAEPEAADAFASLQESLFTQQVYKNVSQDLHLHVFSSPNRDSIRVYVKPTRQDYLTVLGKYFCVPAGPDHVNLFYIDSMDRDRRKMVSRVLHQSRSPDTLLNHICVAVAKDWLTRTRQKAEARVTDSALSVLAASPGVVILSSLTSFLHNVGKRKRPMAKELLHHKSQLSGTIAGCNYQFALDHDSYAGWFSTRGQDGRIPAHISFINNYISTGDSYVKVELMSPEGVGYECSLEPVNLVRNSTEYSVRRAIEGAARGISRLKEMPWDCYG